MSSRVTAQDGDPLARAEALRLAGRSREALALFESILVEQPENVDAMLGAASCALRQRQARRALQRLAENGDNYDPAQRTYWLVLRTEALLRDRQDERAWALIEAHLDSLSAASKAWLYLNLAHLCQAVLKRRREGRMYLAQADSLARGLPLDDKANLPAWTSRHEAGLADTAIVFAKGDVAMRAARRLVRTRYAPAAPIVWLAGLCSRGLLIPCNLTAVLAALLVLADSGLQVPALLCLAGALGLSLLLARVYRIFGPLALAITWGLVGLATYVVFGLLYALDSLPSNVAGVLGCLFIALTVVGLVVGLRRYRMTPEEQKEMWARQKVATVNTPPLPGLTEAQPRPPLNLASRRRRRIVVIVLFLAMVAGVGACCWAILQPPDPEALSQRFEQHRQVMTGVQARALGGIDPQRVAYMHYEQVNEHMRYALLVLDLEESRSGEGTVEFTALLRSTGDYPVQEVRVRLWLIAGDGSIVEAVDMTRPPRNLQPGEESEIRGVFDPANTPPRLLGETLAAQPPLSTSFSTTLDGGGIEPGNLQWIAQALPLIEYVPIWTAPDQPWVAQQIEILVGEVIER
jgi:tetratricopeptide (TPR) repeat protein